MLAHMGIDVWELRVGAGVAGASSADVANGAQPLSGHDAPAGSNAVTAADIATMDWEALAGCVAGCARCTLAAGRTQTVFGVGSRSASWFVLGEAPGAEEDRRGEPFVGRAGQLLNSMLLALGLQREAVYIANILKCRPPGNRDPRPEEALACRDFLARQIELVAPRIILAVGRIAAQNLLGTDLPIGRMRGQLHHYGPRSIPVVVTYHPAYLLRSPGEKRKSWEDLRLALKTYRTTEAVP